jgi:alkyl hydroperoxide reductase subunit AhpC
MSKFGRVILKGDPEDWPALLTAAQVIAQTESPMVGDGSRRFDIRIGTRKFTARITKRSVFIEDPAGPIRVRRVARNDERG